MNAISLAYHDVQDHQTGAFSDPRGSSAAYTIDLDIFRAHLNAVAKSSPDRVQKVLTLQNKNLHYPVLFTFDDGHASAYTSTANELEAHGWRGHFFITTGWIGQPGFMTATQIRELHARGHVIGSHTVTHPTRMSMLSRQQLMSEWGDSVTTLSDLLGSPVNVASVAHGYYSRLVAETAAECGIRYLFNSEPVTTVQSVGPCLVLGRYSVQPQTPVAEVAGIAAGDRWPRWRQSAYWSVKSIAKRLGGEYYLKLRASLLNK